MSTTEQVQPMWAAFERAGKPGVVEGRPEAGAYIIWHSQKRQEFGRIHGAPSGNRENDSWWHENNRVAQFQDWLCA